MNDPPRILVIDDDPSLVRAIRLTLTLDGFQVETASNGLEGLERLFDHSFDLILLDLQMPRMDGRTFFREIRSREIGIPVLILSAYGSESAREELQAETALAKPFHPDALTRTIRDVLDASGNDNSLGNGGPADVTNA